MAFECPTLMYAVSAWASSHLALRDDSFKDLSLRHRGYALARLQESMQKSELSTEMCLAVTMVLCSMECISEATDSWYPHLAGAGGALTSGPDSLRDPKQAVQSTFEGRWLLRNFAYHDVMTSVSLDCRPLITGFYWASEDDSLADPYFGFASRILFLISETSILNADFAEGKANTSIFAEIDADLFQDAYSFNKSGSRKNFSERARLIENELQNWICPLDQDGSPLALLGESYRNAALIHLYRTLRRHINNYTSILQSKINTCVETICELSRDMPKDVWSSVRFCFRFSWPAERRWRRLRSRRFARSSALWQDGASSATSRHVWMFWRRFGDGGAMGRDVVIAIELTGWIL